MPEGPKKYKQWISKSPPRPSYACKQYIQPEKLSEIRERTKMLVQRLVNIKSNAGDKIVQRANYRSIHELS
jgi:hypothetical protein